MGVLGGHRCPGASRRGHQRSALRRVHSVASSGPAWRPFPRQSGGSGLVSTLPDMVVLLRSLLPGGPTLLKPDTIELMMTNQLPEGVWMRFAAYGALRGRGYGLAG